MRHKFASTSLILIQGLLWIGCTTVNEETRVSSPLRAVEYNSVAAKYLERPTFVKVRELSNRKEVLMVEMEQYSYGLGGKMENLNRFNTQFLRDSVSEYVALIDKFLEWEEMAVERGDQFTKEIGTAPAWNDSFGAKQKFEFHSGNTNNHFSAHPMSETCYPSRCIFQQMVFRICT